MKTIKNTSKLLILQIEKRFQQFRQIHLDSPRDGWIRTIRKSLGMTLTQLAQKTGVNIGTMGRIELSEKKGTITISTLKRVAEVLNCQVAVALIPRQNLYTSLKNRAQKVATRLVQQNMQQMNLESQGVAKKFHQEQIKELVDELLRHPDKRLWEER